MCAAVNAVSASACCGFGGLHLLGELLGALPTAPAAPRATPRRRSCWRPSVRRAACRRSRSRPGGAASAASSASTSAGSSPRLRCERAHGVGVFPEQLQVDHGLNTTFDAASPRGASATATTSFTSVTVVTFNASSPVRMEPMSDTPETERRRRRERVGGHWRRAVGWPRVPVAAARTLQATATRRALLLTALGGLLIAGLVTALPIGGPGPGRLAGYIDSDPVPSTGAKSDAAFNRANSGDCLMWPDRHARSPRASSTAQDDHRFEVAESIDMRTFPGSEYGPIAAPAVASSHPADQPGAVRGRGAPLPRPQVRPEQQVHHQHAVVRRQGVAAVRRATDAVRPAAARRRTTNRSPSRARSPTSTSPRSGRPAPAWASTRPPTSPPTSRSTARPRTRWRSPARSTLAEKFPEAHCRRSPSRTATSRTPAPR